MRLSRNISKPRRNLKLANAQDVRCHIPSVWAAFTVLILDKIYPD